MSLYSMKSHLLNGNIVYNRLTVKTTKIKEFFFGEYTRPYVHLQNEKKVYMNKHFALPPTFKCQRASG